MNWLFLGVTLWGIGGWLLYLRERDRTRDYATDLVQLIHDYDIQRDELRRSLGYDEIEEDLERR